MKEITVKENEAGQRLDKLLGKYLNKAPKSFLYKMLRKKNITLNGKKASGNEMTVREDVIRIFLSDETYDKFSGKRPIPHSAKQTKHTQAETLKPEWIIYEDHHILILNKPAGVLSQKAKPADISINEMLLTYLMDQGELTKEELISFRPSVCNRLDRNTSGLLIAGKTLIGLQAMSKVLKERSLHKYYLCLVEGILTETQRIDGYLLKNEKTNKVTVTKESSGDAKPIITEYRPLTHTEHLTLLEVLLVTGRSHQIRAHLSSVGHPLIGDAKYGREAANAFYKKNFGVTHQMLHSCKMVMPVMEGELSYLSGRVFEAPRPSLFTELLKGN